MAITMRKAEPYSQAAIAKLESSGITEQQARALGLYSVANVQVLDQSFDPKPGLVIPYFGIDKRPLSVRPNWPMFYRVRYLEGGPVSFADATESKKPKYVQPPASGVGAYFPNCTEWVDIAADTNEPLLITEGEFKAAKACLEGYPTIGLGGVHNFRQAKEGIFFLPELEAFKWVKRKVTIVYDSDYHENPLVASAINLLAEELYERGAMPYLASLPDVYEEDRKTGLDDFLVARQDDLQNVLRDAQPITIARKLWAMNEEVCYVEDPGLIAKQNSLVRWSPSNFVAHSAYSTDSVPESVLKNNIMSYEKVSAAAAWLKWPLRTSVERITYAPGQDTFVDNKYNEWTGWGCEARKGDVKPWLDLTKWIFAGADAGLLEWFYDWAAYPIQYPGTKLFSAMVVHGRTTGTGKSLLGYTLGEIYGSNFTKVDNELLKRDFNGWAQRRQFVLGDEISGSDKRSESDKLKTVITQEEIWINTKGVPEYQLPDCINYYFTSNHADAFFIEDEDRRYAVHEVLHAVPLSEEFYKAYDIWRRGDGPSALRYWLEQRNLSNFNPKAPAFKTSARLRMASHSKSDLALWLSELKEFPDIVLRVGKLAHRRDLFTAKELLNLYQGEHDAGHKVTVNGMSRALAAAGFRQMFNGVPIKFGDEQGRYWIIRNYHEKWAAEKKLKAVIENLRLTPEKLG